MNSILNDTSKFTKVKIPEGKKILNTILSLEGKIVDFLKSVKKKGASERGLSVKDYLQLYPKGSQPGRLYGLGKVHKGLVNGKLKFRPILSAIGTPSYQIAKFILPLLEPFTKNEFTVKDSFTFSEEILTLSTGEKMASLDIEALFTNLPLDETLNICEELLFERNNLVKGLTRSEFRNLLELATKENLILFDDNYYRQIDGVAMGSPLGPTLANIFLSYHEKTWLPSAPESIKPSFYRRYVDDVFILTQSSETAINFVDYMNKQHGNIFFTYEIEIDHKLPFLDIEVCNKNGSYSTDIQWYICKL